MDHAGKEATGITPGERVSGEGHITCGYCLKDQLLFEAQHALLGKDPHQIQVHIIAAKIFIVQVHVVIVRMIAGGCRAAHKLGEGMPVI